MPDVPEKIIAGIFLENFAGCAGATMGFIASAFVGISLISYISPDFLRSKVSAPRPFETRL